MKLAPEARARLAQKLLASLGSLSNRENEKLWVEEAKRRDAESDPDDDRAADAVLRDARDRRLR